MDCNVGAATDTPMEAEPIVPLRVAVMVVVPAPTPVPTPAELIVATSGFADNQIAVDERFAVVPSL